MVPTPELNERDLDLLVSYPVDEHEAASEAIVNAFMTVDVEAFDRESPLQSQVDTDAIDGFEWESGRQLYVSAEVWDRQVVVTPDRVRVYADTVG